jgi:hypothetical protein
MTSLELRNEIEQIEVEYRQYSEKLSLLKEQINKKEKQLRDTETKEKQEPLQEKEKNYLLKTFGINKADSNIYIVFTKSAEFVKLLERGKDFKYNEDLEEQLRKEKLYKDVIENDKTKRRFDWFLETPKGNVCIEMFGVGKRFNYHNKVIKKINDCVKNNVNLIALFPNDFANGNIDSTLENILGYYGLVNKSNIDEHDVHKFLVNHPDWSHDHYIKQAN